MSFPKGAGLPSIYRNRHPTRGAARPEISVVTFGFGLQCLLSQRNGVVSSPARCSDQGAAAVQELGAKSIYSQHSGVVEVSSKLFPVIDVSTGGYPCSLLPRCLLPCFC